MQWLAAVSAFFSFLTKNTRSSNPKKRPRDDDDPNEPRSSPKQRKMKYKQSHQTVSQFLERCEKENLDLPENPYDAMMEVNKALKDAKGKDEEAMSQLKQKFGKGGTSNKRSHEEEEEKMPHHKRVKLAEEIKAQPANVPENQKIVDAFIEYSLSQLDQGHTGKGSSHLRAAREINNYDKVIKSAKDARDVGFIGERMSAQVQQVLDHGKIIDEDADKNVSKDYAHHEPHIVQEIRDTPAKRKENQTIVDALADFAEHQLEFGNTGKGTSHLRAAREIHNSDIVIKSGFQASQHVGFIGDVMADKIDQILTHGKIVHDEGAPYNPHRVRGDPAPIVQDLKDHPAKHSENQKIVDGLVEYGEAHLTSGHRGKGISHLRAAKSIRDSDVVIKEPKDALKIGMVGRHVVHQVEKIMKHGYADDDSDYEEGASETEEMEEEEAKQYGTRHHHEKGVDAPIVHDIRSKKAKNPANQKLVDAITDFGVHQLQEVHTGRGITYLRAARELMMADEEIKSGGQAMKIGMIGKKVATFIDKTLRGES